MSQETFRGSIPGGVAQQDGAIRKNRENTMSKTIPTQKAGAAATELLFRQV
ncbi:hypothetical protein ACFL5O_04225 [Myxococcota bacterium]